MHSVSLKRDKYVNCIRKGFKQKQIKQLRQIMLAEKPQQLSKLSALIQQCKKSNMQQIKIKICLQYMHYCDVNTVSKQIYVQFLDTILNSIYTKPYEILFINQVSEKVYKILFRIIDNIVKQQQSTLNHILNDCIYKVVSVMENYPTEMLMLWQKVSKIQNISLYNYSINVFLRTIQKLEQVTIEAVQLIVEVFYNFSENKNNDIIQFSTWITITDHLSVMLNNFTLNSLKILDISLLLINIFGKRQENQPKIQAIFNSSNIFQQLFEYLSLKQKMDKQTLIYLVKVASKVFSTSSSLSYRIFQKNLTIIKYLRQLITIDIKNPKSKQPIITITQKINQQLTKYIMHTLSNIVADGCQFVEIYLNSDIFILMKYLIENQHSNKINLEISYVLLNMVIMAEDVHLQIMLEKGLLRILDILLKEQLNQQIQCNGVRAMKQIGIILRKTKTYFYSLNQFKRNIDQTGTYRYIEGLINSRNQKLSNQSLQFVNELP